MLDQIENLLTNSFEIFNWKFVRFSGKHVCLSVTSWKSSYLPIIKKSWGKNGGSNEWIRTNTWIQSLKKITNLGGICIHWLYSDYDCPHITVIRCPLLLPKYRSQFVRVLSLHCGKGIGGEARWALKLPITMQGTVCGTNSMAESNLFYAWASPLTPTILVPGVRLHIKGYNILMIKNLTQIY